MSLFRLTSCRIFFNLWVYGLFFLAPSAVADAVSQQTVLAATVERLKTNGFSVTDEFRQRQWLADTPRLSIMHWQTRNRDIGSDETELLLELEFLTPAQQQLMTRSGELFAHYQLIQQQQLELTASQMLRQLFWHSRQLSKELDYAEQNANQLQHLLKQTRDLVDKGEQPVYAGIVVQQQLQNARSRVAKKQIALQQLTRLWQHVTGREIFPETLKEPTTVATELTQHPRLQSLQLQWQIALNASQQTAAEQKSWGLTGGYKYIDMVSQSESQWGLGLSIPLTFSRSLNANEMIALQQQQSELNSVLRQTQLSIELDVAESQSRVAQLQQQLETDRINADLSAAAMEQLKTLYQQGQIDTRLYIERLLEQMAFQQAAQVTEIELQLAKALLNQARGITL